MQLFTLGLNHKTAPVEVRERLALPPSHLPHVLSGLREQGAREAAVLSTCNRAEIYVVGPDDMAPQLETFLARYQTRGAQRHNPDAVSIGAASNIAIPDIDQYFYRYHGADSARHLFRVASGVDSLVLGESQILGQVKTAFEEARVHGALGATLDELFRRAISCGKRARHETEIGRGAQSIGSASVELARQIFGPLQGHTVLILGAGKMSELTAKNLISSGARRIIVANRTHQRARELAALWSDENASDASDTTADNATSAKHGTSALSARAIRWEEFPAHLIEADIVIASTRAPGFVLSSEQVATAMKSRRSRPLLLIDIAVPRDIDPQAHNLDNVFLYDIDDLQRVVNRGFAQRGSEVARVETIIESEVAAWDRWHRALGTRPLMAALAQHAAHVRDQEVEAALAQMPDLAPREREIVRALGRSITGKLMHAPLRHLRQAGESGSSDVDALRRVFALDEIAPNRAQDDALPHNETSRNETSRNETSRNETSRNETSRRQISHGEATSHEATARETSARIESETELATTLGKVLNAVDSSAHDFDKHNFDKQHRDQNVAGADMSTHVAGEGGGG